MYKEKDFFIKSLYIAQLTKSKSVTELQQAVIIYNGLTSVKQSGYLCPEGVSWHVKFISFQPSLPLLCHLSLGYTR